MCRSVRRGWLHCGVHPAQSISLVQLGALHCGQVGVQSCEMYRVKPQTRGENPALQWWVGLWAVFLSQNHNVRLRGKKNYVFFFFPIVYFTRSVLKPSTLPDIQVTDVDAAVNTESTGSNTGENELGLSALPSLRSGFICKTQKLAF